MESDPLPTDYNQYRGGEVERAVKQVVDAVASNQAQKTKEIKRLPRYPFNLPVTISAVSASRTLKQIAAAWTLDISYEGIGFLGEYKFMPKEVIYVDLEKVIGRPFEIQTQVTHCKNVFGKVYRVGGLFQF